MFKHLVPPCGSNLYGILIPEKINRGQEETEREYCVQWTCGCWRTLDEVHGVLGQGECNPLGYPPRATRR